MLKNLNELAEKIHENAVIKGFWDKELEGTHIVMICSELYELLDAIRKNKKCEYKDIQLIEGNNKKGYWLFDCKKNLFFNFEFCVKGTIEDECADIVIRCLDYLYKHSKEKDIKKLFYDFSYLYETKEETLQKIYKNECEFIYALNYAIISNVENLLSFVFVIIGIVKYCQENNIDLQTHIELKMKYNETRPKLHGNKF